MSATALIVGAGTGISASFARVLHRQGYMVALAARTPGNVQAFADEIGATTHACDATDPDQVASLFGEFDAAGIELDVVLYNASARAHGPITELDPAEVAGTVAVPG